MEPTVDLTHVSTEKKGLDKMCFGKIRSLFIPSMLSFAILVVPLVAQGEGLPDEPQKAQPNLDSKTSKALLKFGATFVKGSWEVIDPLKKYELPHERVTELSTDGARLVERYRKGIRDNKFGADLFEGIFETSILAGAATYTIATGGVGAPIAIIGAGVASYANAKATEALHENMRLSTAKMFVDGLREMDAKDKSAFNDRLANKDYVGAAQLFEARTQKVSAIATEVKAITQEFAEGQDVEKMTNELVAQTLVGGTVASLEASAANYHEIQGVKQDLANQIAFTHKFTKDTEKGLTNLSGDVKKLNTEIGNLKSEIASLGQSQDTTAYQVQMIQQVMFGQQPPSVKVQMLRNHMLPGLTETQRTGLIKLYTAEAKKNEIISDVSKVVNTARDVAKILGDLGVKDPGIGQVVQYASVAQTALSFAFSTPPNPIGAIAAVTGLFGKGADDPNQQQFAMINQQLQSIRKQLDTVISLQLETLKAIEALSEQMARMEKNLNERLDSIEFEQKRIANIVTKLLWSKYATCSDAFDERRKFFDDTHLRFTSGPAIVRFTNGYFGKIFPCAKALSSLYAALRNDEFFGNPLSLEGAINGYQQEVPEVDHDNQNYKKSELKKFQEEIYTPTVSFALAEWPTRKLGGLANMLTLYTQPSSNVAELYEKIDRLKGASSERWNPLPCSNKSLLTLHAKRFLCATSIEFDENADSGNNLQAEKRAYRFLSEPILREQVGALIKWTALVAHPYDFAPGGAGGQSPLKVTDLLDGAINSPIIRGRNLVQGSLFVLDLSIAQQAMLYGDLTAFFVAERLWDPAKRRLKSEAELSVDDSAGRLAWKLLRNESNPWLRESVAMLILDANFRKCKKRNVDPDNCQGRHTLYEIAMKEFMPVSKEKENEPAHEIDPSSDQIAAGAEWMRELFKFSAEVTWEVKRNQGQKRIVNMNMSGIALPLPDVTGWVEGRLRYPTGLRERLHERELMVDNYIDYTILEELPESGERLVRVLANPGNF